MKVKDTIYSFFAKREGETILKNLDEINLINEGILDSLGVVELISYLEQKYEIRIDYEALDNLDFSSISEIIIFFEALIKGQEIA